MAWKLPRSVCCSILYCSTLSCLGDLYIWGIFIEIQHGTLQEGKPANDFIFKMQQLHDPFMPSITRNFSLNRKREKAVQVSVPALCFDFYHCHTDDVEKQQGLTADSYRDLPVFLLHFSIFNLLMSRKKKVKDWVNPLLKLPNKLARGYHLMRPWQKWRSWLTASAKREFIILSKMAASSATPYLSANALAAHQSAGPLTAEMAEVSGVHYLCNTTVEENRLFLRFPMAHSSRKSCTPCPLERIKVACPVPQDGLDVAKSENETCGKRGGWQEGKAHRQQLWS